MAEDINSKEDHRDRVEASQKTFYTRLEKGGLNYINHKKNYLLFSAVIPIFIITVQSISFIFQIILSFTGPGRGPPLHEVLAPMTLLLIIGLFTLINFLFLLRWKNKTENYISQQTFESKVSKFDEEMESTKKRITLTEFFYEIVRNMNIIKIFFIFLNAVCVYYYIWYYGFFMGNRPPSNPLMNAIMTLTIVSQIVLIIYLIYEWNHFLKWNKKLQALKSFERQIYQDLFLE